MLATYNEPCFQCTVPPSYLAHISDSLQKPIEGLFAQ